MSQREVGAVLKNSSIDVVRAFNRAFNARDVNAVMELMTEDVQFEGTSPPDGDRHVGAEAVRREWERLFASTRDLSFDTEEMFDAGDRVVVRWTFHWTGEVGPEHVRGVDVFRLREGLIAEKLSYVKG
jgi:ketosteroid isomerase-like protein